MKYILLALVVAFQVTQEPPEAYPGQREHREPPLGWMCQNQNVELSVPPDHVCSCERMIDENGKLHEDSECASFCHADHCSCRMSDATKHKTEP